MPTTYAVCDRCQPVVAGADTSGIPRQDRPVLMDRLDTVGPLVLTGTRLDPCTDLCDVCGGILVAGAVVAVPQ